MKTIIALLLALVPVSAWAGDYQIALSPEELGFVMHFMRSKGIYDDVAPVLFKIQMQVNLADQKAREEAAKAAQVAATPTPTATPTPEAAPDSK